jgi:glycosyltransferase involved in cell wall biosynthesis
MPLVDVVIPAYNPGPFLEEALRSLVAQTLTDWRAFVVDDGSTEDLGWVGTLDARIVRLRQANAGPSAARNRGIAEGSAPFIAFLDADDLWLPRKLKVQTQTMTSEVGLSSTAFEIVDAAGVRTGGGFEGYATSRTELLQGNGICASTVMVRRDVLARAGPFRVELRQVQDWDLWIRIAETSVLIKVPEVLARYRVHSANLSGNYLRLLREGTQVLRSYGPDASARIGIHRLRQLAGAQAFDAFRSTRRPEHLYRALRLSPAYTSRALLATALKR